jgi:hypothetical protein
MVEIMVVMMAVMLVEKLVLVMMKWSVGMLVQSKAGLMAVLTGVGKEEMMVVMMVDWKEEKKVLLTAAMLVVKMVLTPAFEIVF